MSTFNVGDEVEVILSANVTTVAEVLTRTDHRGNVTTLYRLEGRPRDVLYLAEDLRRYTRTAPVQTDTSTSTQDVFTQVLVANMIMDQMDDVVDNISTLNHSIPESVCVPEVTYSPPVSDSWSSSIDDSSSRSSWGGDSSYSSSSSDYSSSSSDSGSSSSCD